MSTSGGTTPPASGGGAAPAGSATVGCPDCAEMEIQINNTPTANDDLVQVTCKPPRHSHPVKCRIRAKTACASANAVVLTNPDGKLRFNGSAKIATLSVPADGSWAAFTIGGHTGSSAIGDAIIEAHCHTEAGAVKATKAVTVFWFDQAQITLTPGGLYSLVGTLYSAAGVACSFSAQARIRPAGVDCTAPQVKDLRVGILQESSNYSIIDTWDTPTVAWNAGAASGTSINVTAQYVTTETYAATVHQPVNDGDPGTPASAGVAATPSSYPLYEQAGPALAPPMGCTGGAAATSNDNPQQAVTPTAFQDVSVGGAIVARVTWTNLVSTVRKEHFRTLCVIWNTVKKHYCPERQANWDVNCDSSGPAANQQATSTADAAVSTAPATGVQANNAPDTTTVSNTGAPVNFVKP